MGMSFDQMMRRYCESRNAKRRAKVLTFQYRVFSKIPPWNTPLFHYITAFWIGLIDEGPYQMLKPRWGGITFGWLNDGMKPTVWHTLRQLLHDQTDPYTGIYPNGAPKSLEQAKRWEEEWRS